ncbi:MAG TPA: PaaX family transcriptional regulator C-terminal domain-containing protein [Acidimicrobiales bacterium]|nr:PaaX family transcriptional regulator C-terminal domain-containing protein [Acidimicrobiales bacterium]
MPELSARSLVASLLLGSEPPELPVRLLVRTAELFGIAEGATRVAISRMVAAGELEAAGEGRYRLSGPLAHRQARQAQGRRPAPAAWDGTWVVAVVPGGARGASDRAALRSAALDRRLAEVRDGVWTRPDNLGPASPGADPVITEQCELLTGARHPYPAGFAASLWDLSGWAAQAERLLGAMDGRAEVLARRDASGLPGSFQVAAATVRHLASDPLLPEELLPAAWPGARLRAAYDRFEADFQATLGEWYRS